MLDNFENSPYAMAAGGWRPSCRGRERRFQHISTRRECGHNCVPRPTRCDPSLLAQATWSIKSGSAVSWDWGAPHVCANQTLEERASFERLPIHDTQRQFYGEVRVGVILINHREDFFWWGALPRHPKGCFGAGSVG